ncbi:MAG: DUF58 domain-containing protein [Chitinivibrionales bacterium]|nr:DUF58 domain-containing protein [Chitinivibrionales bacterium]
MNSRAITFLKPEHLAPIRSLSLRARHIVEGMIAGLHKSPYHGFSAEFLEYRPYLPGESTRRIDWRKYAKTDRTVVRLYEDETNLFAHILLDKSGSMAMKSHEGFSKFDYARTLAASLAWILIRQKDAAGLTCFDNDIRLYMAPRSTNRRLNAILRYLQDLSPGRETGCGHAIDHMAQRLTKRGLSIVISDFFDDPGSIIRGLRHLRFKRQDVIIFWILDPAELAFSHDGPLRIHDLETGKELALDSQTAREHFMRGFCSHRTQIERACKELAIDCDIISTRTPFQKALLAALDKRRRLC